MADETIFLLATPIEPVKLKDALEERYFVYALSTILHRALPDVRERAQARAPARDLRHAPAQARPRHGFQEMRARGRRRHR